MYHLLLFHLQTFRLLLQDQIPISIHSQRIILTIMLVVMSQHKNRSGWLLRQHILQEAVTILMLHQEMLDTKTSVILGNATGEEVQGSHPEGTEDGGGQEVGPVTAIEKEIDGIDLIGNVVLIEIVNGIVIVIETEIEK